jgi:hypothetical protein
MQCRRRILEGLDLGVVSRNLSIATVFQAFAGFVRVLRYLALLLGASEWQAGLVFVLTLVSVSCYAMAGVAPVHRHRFNFCASHLCSYIMGARPSGLHRLFCGVTSPPVHHSP